MPLRDHFHPPLADLASWEELHGLWPGVMAMRLNSILPPQYRSGVRVHLGSIIEVDVATFELDSEVPTPPEYEVLVYDMKHTRRLVAAVELVSPGNKDRAESRDAFVSKCHALLQQDVCVAIVDPVTERAGNLYVELAERIGADSPKVGAGSIYAVSCRGRVVHGRWRVESWPHDLVIGSQLPTLPLWLNETECVPLELEATYDESCRGLRLE